MIEILELVDAIKFLRSDKRGREVNGDYIKGSLLNATSPRTRSVSKQAKANICQFPLLVSGNLSISAHNDVSNSLEQLYANYIKMVVMNNAEVVDLTKDGNARQFMDNLHQNDTAYYGMSNPNQIIDSAVNYMKEGSLPFSLTVKNFRNEDFVKANRELNKPYLENFNLGLLNTDENGEILHEETSEEQLLRNYKEIITLRDAQIECRKKIIAYEDDIRDHNSGVRKLSSQAFNKIKEDLKREKEVYSQYESLISDISKRRTLIMQEDARKAKELSMALNNTKTTEEVNEIRNKNRVTSIKSDNAVKKANDLDPTVFNIEIDFNNGNNFLKKTISIGVKTISHLIPAEEMCYFIPDSLIKKKAIFRFIQWTTGEIKFMKDFILDLDNVKFQATTDKKSVKWWKHLHTRSNASRLKGFFKHEGLIPNATIVLTKEDMEFIRIKNKIDLMGKNKDQVSKLMDYFFLLGMVVVDEADELVYIYDDVSRDWERYTYGQLSKETKDSLKRDNKISLR